MLIIRGIRDVRACASYTLLWETGLLQAAPCQPRHKANTAASRVVVGAIADDALPRIYRTDLPLAIHLDHGHDYHKVLPLIGNRGPNGRALTRCRERQRINHVRAIALGQAECFAQVRDIRIHTRRKKRPRSRLLPRDRRDKEIGEVTTHAGYQLRCGGARCLFACGDGLGGVCWRFGD